jgi:hypothetical protein
MLKKTRVKHENEYEIEGCGDASDILVPSGKFQIPSSHLSVSVLPQHCYTGPYCSEQDATIQYMQK